MRLLALLRLHRLLRPLRLLRLLRQLRPLRPLRLLPLLRPLRPLRLLPPVLMMAACVTPQSPATSVATPKPTAEEIRQKCLGQMYSARMRGAVHWHIYEFCLKESA